MRRLLLGVGFVAGAIAIAATLAVATRATASAPDDLQAAQAALSRYHSFTQALKDGYSVENEPCVQAPPPPGLTGAMGIHAVNEALLRDPAIDPLRPELLLYMPKGNGQLELVGVEYMRIAADQVPPIDTTDQPSIFGRPFDGPMPEHVPGMGWHYDIHLWFWADNPAGFFAPFNPALNCP